jgi:hypothetical protein
MKKLFTLLAVAFAATSMNAQIINFGEAAVANADLPAAWQSGDLKLVLTNDGKPSVDLNTASFGTADAFNTYNSRLKTGGASSSKRFLTLTVPSDGHVKVAARTGSNTDATRTITLTQNDTELLTYKFDEANAITASDGATKVYPYAEADVKAGDVVITFTVNGINIYAIEFTAATTGINQVGQVTTTQGVTYNLAGQRVSDNYKGVVIRDGKKLVQK